MTGQPSQPMGWPGFWSETVLPYLFKRMLETNYIQLFCYFYLSFFKNPSFTGSNSKTAWTIIDGFGGKDIELQLM